MKSLMPLLLVLLLPSFLAILSTAKQDFDFFYFVLQWPGSYCDTRRSCCYPSTGKPAADFGIHGLWPNNNDGSWPSNCDPDSEFDSSKIDDLMEDIRTHWPTLSCPSNDGTKFWTHEWEKHGTCSESALDQHAYFKSALTLKNKLNLLQVLTDEGIEPDGGFYNINRVKNAIKRGTGFTPGIECNVDESRNSQLYQIYMCVDTSGTEFIECPLFPRTKCGSRIEFPAF